MTVTQLIRRSGQYFRTSTGSGSDIPAGGAYTAELYQFANIASGTTDGAIVAAVANKRIRVLSYAVSALTAGATTAIFTSKPGGAGTAISHTISLAANGNFGEDSESGLFQTASGQGLSLTTGAGAGVGVRVTYILVD